MALGASNWPANQVAAGLKLREPVAEAGTGMVFSTIARAASEVVVLHFSQDITNRAAAAVDVGAVDVDAVDVGPWWGALLVVHSLMEEDKS
jgi:hypothetical protein